MTFDCFDSRELIKEVQPSKKTLILKQARKEKDDLNKRNRESLSSFNAVLEF